MALVSVVIPVYNRAGLIRRAVVSVLNQTFGDFECIVVDDGSEVDCLSAIRGLDPRIKTIKLPYRCGVSHARNTGAEHSDSPWIAFLDSDDEWLPKKLEQQLDWAHRKQQYSILQSKEEWIRNGVFVNPPYTHCKQGGDIFALSLERCMITPSSVLIKRDLFRYYGGFNESLPACEDYDLWLRITVKHHVGLVDEVLLKRYGGHSDQLSTTTPVLDRFRIRSLLGLLFKEELTSEQRSMVRRQIKKKALICANGYRKRGNNELFRRYKTIAERFGED